MSAQHDRGELEVIVPEHGGVVRWHTHGYPTPLAKWHHHPEVEFHLIRQGTGHMMAGDALVPFEPRQVSVVGGGIPHNWISDLAPGEMLPERDIVCQVHPRWLRGVAEVMPGAEAISRVLERAQHGIVLGGESGDRAAQLLERMGDRSALERIGDLLGLIAVFAQAPAQDWSTVVTPNYDPEIGAGTVERMNAALGYLNEHLADDVSLPAVAAAAGMSPAAFSRFFHKAAGISLSDLVRRLRIARAARMLASTDAPISRIPFECGYQNLSNFNRRFKQETGMTPREYRRSRLTP